MLIYFNGDSNTSGMELDDPSTQSFSAHLSRKLNANYINHSVPGGSNEMIFRTTYQYLDQCKQQNTRPDLIIIGWTESCREDWFVDGKYMSIDSLGINRPVDSEARYQDYFRRTRNMNYRHHVFQFYNAKIFDFHLELQNLGIPHLFFNAIECFNRWEHSDDLVHRFDWGKNFYHPYNQEFAMRHYAIARDYEEITPGWHHFKENFQIVWADLLHEHIISNQLA